MFPIVFPGAYAKTKMASSSFLDRMGTNLTDNQIIGPRNQSLEPCTWVCSRTREPSKPTQNQNKANVPVMQTEHRLRKETKLRKKTNPRWHPVRRKPSVATSIHWTYTCYIVRQVRSRFVRRWIPFLCQSYAEVELNGPPPYIYIINLQLLF